MSDRMFPIMFGGYRVDDRIKTLRAAGVPFAVVCIPWEMIEPHDKQAKANHDQTLKRLAERGGLSAAEAIQVLEGKRLYDCPLDDAAANHKLTQLVSGFMYAQAAEQWRRDQQAEKSQ